MTSFVKHIAVLTSALVATTALAEKPDDGKSSKTGAQATTGKGGKASEEPVPRKKTDVPVIKGHDSKGLVIPYYDSNGRHEMQFHIDVASRVDDNHVHMTNLLIETYDEHGDKELNINLPTATLNTDTGVVISKQPVKIHRDDFDLTGEAMLFNTRTKQGGLAGNVRMLIYNLKDQTSGADQPDGGQPAAKKPKPQNEPDSFKTPQSRVQAGAPISHDNLDKFRTPGPK